MQPVLLKVYGNLTPITEKLYEEIKDICRQAFPREGDYASLEDELLRISFEGIYFPIEEIIASITAQHGLELEGKIDFLDIENWKMTRYLFKNGALTISTRPLNNVLDFSGH